MIAVLIAALAALALAMTAAWYVVRRTGQSGWADTVWSLATGIVGAGAALIPLGSGGPQPRALLVAALVACWSLRLGMHIGRRTLGGGDDPRYAELRRQWGERYSSRLFLFLQIQAGAAFVLVAATLAAAHNPAPLGLFDLLAVLIARAAMAGEALSDSQLARSRADPRNRGRICDTGLWGLSRHPNYFFEWLFWAGIAVFGMSLPGAYPWGWLALAAPLMMYWLLVHVSGVPPLEAHMRRSRGSVFSAYAQRVPAFWPVGRRGR